MRIDWWTLGLQAINAVVLIWLLGRFLFKPVAAIIAERQAAAEQVGAQAEALRSAAERDRAAAQAAEADIAAHRAAQMKAAADAAAAERERLMAAARDDAGQLRAAARAEIERQRANEEHRAGRRAADLAVAISARLLARLPDDSRILPFLPGLGDGIAALSDEVRAGLAHDLTVRVPRLPDDAERAAIDALLAARLDLHDAPRVTADPALIAGIELAGAHAVVRNSLRADLDRIAGEMARDGG